MDNEWKVRKVGAGYGPPVLPEEYLFCILFNAKVVCALVVGLELNSMVLLGPEYFSLNPNYKPLIRYFAVA